MVGFGYSVAGLKAAGEAERTGSMYAFARSLALLTVAVIAVFAGSIAFLAAIAVAMIVVQIADAVIGMQLRNRLKTIGPAMTAAVNAGVLIWLLLE